MSVTCSQTAVRASLRVTTNENCVARRRSGPGAAYPAGALRGRIHMYQ
ncbi:hypothetical protein AZ14_0975, partial [Bordetella bronchiseptica 980]